MEILKSYNAIIVDDDKNISSNMFKLLKLYFKEVHSFEDAESAFEFIQENSVSIIISDIELPGMNELKFAKKVKEFDESIEILILTSFATLEYLKEAASLHLIDYLEKPISLDKLESILQICAQKLKKNLHYNILISKNIIINFYKKALRQRGSS
ncbi:MAG: response regulator [Sulfurimonas denitrificans]|nr:response regulator [Sulfurimonas denitrificans]